MKYFFYIFHRPSADTHIPSLRLIDFGCAIDMTLFKEGQEFRKVKIRSISQVPMINKEHFHRLSKQMDLLVSKCKKDAFGLIKQIYSVSPVPFM